MKTRLFLPVFFLFSLIVRAQNADSLAVAREVDSLIQVSRALTDKQNFDKALQVIEFLLKFNDAGFSKKPVPASVPKGLYKILCRLKFTVSPCPRCVLRR